MPITKPRSLHAAHILAVSGMLWLCAAAGYGEPDAAPACPVNEGVIKIVHPCEGAALPFLRSTFVFGSTDPRGTLAINGETVPVHPGGGFIAMVNLSTGTCRIIAVLTVDTATYAVERAVTVAPPDEPLPVSPLAVASILPDSDYEVAPGEEIVVACKASPGMDASFTVDGARGSFPMIEMNPGRGNYRGVYIPAAEDKLNASKIRVALADKKKHKKIRHDSGGGISFFPRRAPVIGQVSAERSVLRAGPGGAFMLFLQKGTNLRITGRRGNDLRVRLSGTRDAWVARKDVTILPAGTPASAAAAENIVVAGGERLTSVRLSLSGRVPFEIAPDPDGRFLDIRLFGALSKTDLIIYRSTGAVEQVRWYQDDTDTYRMRLYARPGRWWGYDARYENSSFVFELRSPPAALRAGKVLEGITIAVDPGHSPETGAVGPTGLMEKDANLALARAVKEELAAHGATVVMTRANTEAVSLYDRPKAAVKANADILVSIHQNALADGQNPFERNGYGVYYYQPTSLPLARAVHDAYRAHFSTAAPAEMALRDDGLYYDDLAIPRTTQMPTILVESAYIMFPREEALLKTPAFRARCAAAIAAGIAQYIGDVCPREKPPVQKKKKAKK